MSYTEGFPEWYARITREHEQMRLALLTAKAMIEEPSNNPKNRNDLTQHRQNGLIAEVYAAVVQGLSGIHAEGTSQ